MKHSYRSKGGTIYEGKLRRTRQYSLPNGLRVENFYAIYTSESFRYFLLSFEKKAMYCNASEFVWVQWPEDYFQC
ncbi:hypothetical protein ACHAW5_001350 [Stephanodiscus triporus]|uniref:Uncharacterized protein n=1 Tax=Stephanodiscus triporus TaxID=2934178 RepID=A0ABD3NYZ1_9STRA